MRQLSVVLFFILKYILETYHLFIEVYISLNNISLHLNFSSYIIFLHTKSEYVNSKIIYTLQHFITLKPW